MRAQSHTPDEALTGFLARYDGLRSRLPGPAVIARCGGRCIARGRLADAAR